MQIHHPLRANKLIFLIALATLLMPAAAAFGQIDRPIGTTLCARIVQADVVNGIKWLFEPADPNSGYRSSQMMGISEHYELIVPALPKEGVGNFADYLYTPGRSVEDMWNGLWGIMRAYGSAQKDLLPLPSNPNGGKVITNTGDFDGICPRAASVREFDITAALAKHILPVEHFNANQVRPASVVGLHPQQVFLDVTRSDGTYTLTASFPETGVYYVFVEVPSLGLRLNEQRPVILQAVGTEVPKESP